jgi:hypothetical protein
VMIQTIMNLFVPLLISDRNLTLSLLLYFCTLYQSNTYVSSQDSIL